MANAPTEIKLHRKSRTLEIGFSDQQRYVLSFEFLRVHSPSAEVRGHGPGEETLQTGKRGVTITGLEPTGNYAVKISFDDGHDSGIYSWEYLRHLGENEADLWEIYLTRLHAAGETRDPDTAVVKLMNPG
jgi:DUF971 family protein